MNTRTLGKTGYIVSEIGLGCWQLGGDFGPVGDDTANEILRTARSLDVNFWDTADVYGAGQSERRIGDFKDKKG
ncbi:MAG: aldo/keto reductase, partial [Devosia sp.]